MALVFDPVAHTYTVDGVRLPSVTQILNDVGLVDLSFVDRETLAKAANLGGVVHKATELDDISDLDESSLTPEVEAFVLQWRAFKKDWGFEPMEEFTECHMASKIGFAGTNDRYGYLARVNSFCIVDIKTGAKMKATGCQIAGYKHLMLENFRISKSVKCFGVYLRTTGYEVVDFQDAAHKRIDYWNVFLSALNVYKFKGGI